MKLIQPYPKELKKCLAHSSMKIQNEWIRGIIELKSFRKYCMSFGPNTLIEVDISFKGEMHAYHDKFGKTWYSSDILKQPNTSKIRINKNIRGQSYVSVANFLTMFFGEGHYYEIKKVTWE